MFFNTSNPCITSNQGVSVGLGELYHNIEDVIDLTLI